MQPDHRAKLDRERLGELARAVVHDIVDGAVRERPTPVQAAGRARAAVWRLAESDCEGARGRQNPRWRRIATLAANAACVAAQAPPPEPRNDHFMSPDDFARSQRWHTQSADGAVVGDLPTVTKLLRIPSSRSLAIRVLHAICASRVPAQIRELQEQAIPLAQTIGQLLASADDLAVRCGAMGVAAVAHHDAVRASLFHSGQMERVLHLASAAEQPSAPGALANWQREERKEASAQRTCREATLRLKSAHGRAQIQLRVAEKADAYLKQRLDAMEIALDEADRQEEDADKAYEQATLRLNTAQSKEKHAADEVEMARESLGMAEQMQAEATNDASAAAAKAVDAAEAKAEAEAAEKRALEDEEKADAALKAQQAAEQELAEVLRVLAAGLVTEGERKGQKMKKQEKQDAEATVAAKREQLAAAPASQVDATVEQAALDAAQAEFEGAKNDKKARKEAEVKLTAKKAELQAAKSQGIARAKQEAVDARVKATANREDADHQKNLADSAQAEAEARVEEAQEAVKSAEAVLADKHHVSAKAVNERRQAEEAKASALRQQEEAERCRHHGNIAHEAYKKADRAARDERAKAARLKSAAELNRRSEFFIARSIQQSAEAPQTWGLPRELRRKCIARKLEELETAERLQHLGTRIWPRRRAVKQDLSQDHAYEITEQHRRNAAERLARIVHVRTQRLAASLPDESDAADSRVAPVEALTEADNEELSAEDIALQQKQFVQFAIDGNIDFADLAQVSSLPTVLKLIEIPQLVKQACETIRTMSETIAPSDKDALKKLAAPSVVAALSDALASGCRSNACAAAKVVGVLADHDIVREALFTHGVFATLHRLLVSKPPISFGAAPMRAAHSVPRAVLDSIVDSALAAANSLPTAVFEAVNAILHAENKLDRNAARTAWFAARPHHGCTDLRNRLTIGLPEAMHRLAVLDKIALPFGREATSYGSAVAPQSSTRRYDARATAARRARRCERNWGSTNHSPVLRNPIESAGGAMQREKDLRIERAQRADLQLYRDLSKAAEERKRLASTRVAGNRLKKRLGISTLPP